MTLWLYLHFPTLQLDTLFSDSLETPICIIEKQHVVQINNVAKNKGVAVGMGLGSAASLCSNLQVHAYNRDIEVDKLQEIAHWLYMVTSDISFVKPSGLLLKVNNMLTLYDGLASYWKTVHRHLSFLNIQFQFATGTSPLAAKLLAQQGINTISDDESWLLNTLKQQPIHTAELSNKIIEKLHRVGIQHLKGLLSLELADIARRFDISLVNYIGRLTGQFKHLVDFYYPPETFKRYLELLFEIDNVQWLEKPLFLLLSQLEAFLKLRDQVAYEITLILHQRGEAEQNIIFTSAQGDYLTLKWQKLSQLTLESIKLNAPVIGITLLSTNIGQQQADGNDLFDGQQGHLSSLELLSKLQAKLGNERVSGIKHTNDPRPEKTTQFCPPFTPDSKQHSQDINTDTKKVRPSILFPSPLPLQEKVSILQGPERLTTGWWDDEEVVRDYFVVRNMKGQWLWVFRNQYNQLFVHGIFA